MIEIFERIVKWNERLGLRVDNDRFAITKDTIAYRDGTEIGRALVIIERREFSIGERKEACFEVSTLDNGQYDIRWTGWRTEVESAVRVFIVAVVDKLLAEIGISADRSAA